MKNAELLKKLKDEFFKKTLEKKFRSGDFRLISGFIGSRGVDSQIHSSYNIENEEDRRISVEIDIYKGLISGIDFVEEKKRKESSYGN